MKITLKSITFPKLIRCAEGHYIHGINDLPRHKSMLEASKSTNIKLFISPIIQG